MIVPNKIKKIKNTNIISLSIIEYNDIKKISHLQKLKSITIVNNNQITDKQFIHILNLEYVNISNTILNGDLFHHLQNIKCLIIDRCSNIKKHNFIALKYMKQLRKLKINDANIENEQLNILTYLEELSISNLPNITDDGLLNLIHLKVLTVENQNNIDGSCFKDMISLTELTINRMKIYDFKLHQCCNINTLKLVNVEYITGSCFSYFKKLTSLSISICNDINIQYISQLSQLISLSIVQQRIYILPVGMFKNMNLRYLSTFNHKIDVKFIKYTKHMNKLSYLKIKSMPKKISKSHIMSNFLNLKNIETYYNK